MLQSKLSSEDEIIKLFQPSSLLPPNDISYIKNELKIEESSELSLEESTSYFENFNIEYFNDRMLVIKDISVHRELLPN